MLFPLIQTWFNKITFTAFRPWCIKEILKMATYIRFIQLPKSRANWMRASCLLVTFCVCKKHYSDVIMSTIASQNTSLTIVYSAVHSDPDQRKHQSSASLAFVRGIHQRPVNSPPQMASNAENVSIWWRHHERPLLLLKGVHVSASSQFFYMIENANIKFWFLQ